jgi:hypothetical protein
MLQAVAGPDRHLVRPFAALWRSRHCGSGRVGPLPVDLVSRSFDVHMLRSSARPREAAQAALADDLGDARPSQSSRVACASLISFGMLAAAIAIIFGLNGDEIQPVFR